LFGSGLRKKSNTAVVSHLKQALQAERSAEQTVELQGRVAVARGADGAGKAEACTEYMAEIRMAALLLRDYITKNNQAGNRKMTFLKYEQLPTGLARPELFPPIVWTETEKEQLFAAAKPYSKARVSE
jgi:hypothetical protein